MSDPRLNSIHLEALPRRSDYRSARARLLGSCGSRTLAVDPAAMLAEEATRVADPNAITGCPRSPAAEFWLVDSDAVYPLKTGLNTVGRMTDNDVAILDASISRRHCAIVVHAEGKCEVHDTASKNGTYVNGQRVKAPLPVGMGDEIRMCDRKFVFMSGSRPKPKRRDDSATMIEN